MRTTEYSIEHKPTKTRMVEMASTCIDPWALEQGVILWFRALVYSHDDQVSAHIDRTFYNGVLVAL